ncbi:uncharacterized protein LOC123554728 isoform X1 [Mercenaria mercenaria]|uniref:uncharacterized protein LOC123554728 isoform X1 n=1 Tax=Mercenaria mercenaria TaxID=6596 RepID=UPI00234F3AF0|nr:uncharacterized protein LOC123554728 isoform X1 [Mercenaria mercenaria]
MESSISVWNKCYGKQEHLKETSSDDNHQEVLYRVILTVFGSVAVLLLSLILLVGVFVSLEAGYSTTGYYNKFVQQFSIPCDDLSLSPDEDFNLFNINRHKFTYSVHNDVYICTFRNVTEVIFIFVQRIGRLRLSQGLESQPYLQCGNSTLKPASGHLTATFSKVSRHHTYKEQEFDQTISWDKHSSSAFISESLEYLKGKLRVPEGRVYFVYAAVQFNISTVIAEKSSDTSRQWKVSLRMCVSSGEHERTLLYRSKVFSTSETDIVSSLNVGSHVFLAKEEDVYVKISNAEGLIHDSDGNSFGIFPMY